MTAFGGIFRTPSIEGSDETGETGERARIVGLDLDSGVVRIRPPRPAAPQAGGDTPTADDAPTGQDDTTGQDTTGA